MLQPVELLDNQLIRVTGPIHSGEVMHARIAGNLHPARLSALCGNYTYSGRGVLFPSFRISKDLHGWIQGIRVINQSVIPNTCAVELPVSDALAIQAPSPAVPNAQFFLIDPVRGAVNRRAGTIAGQLADMPAGGILNIDVIAANTSHSLAV